MALSLSPEKGVSQMKKWLMTLLTVVLFGIAGLANATLFDRGGGLIYDDYSNITWLQDANYAKTSGYDSDGYMTWWGAMTWADNLVYQGYSDWRLPDAHDWDGGGPCSGWNCYNSEMGHFGILSLPFLFPWNNPFINLEQSLYWSHDMFDDGSGLLGAWYTSFFVDATWQNVTDIALSVGYAWGVRDGDVAAIPEPETYTMLFAGLGLLGFMTRRRKQRTA
jgi:PEP-CTERM motif